MLLHKMFIGEGKDDDDMLPADEEIEDELILLIHLR